MGDECVGGKRVGLLDRVGVRAAGGGGGSALIEKDVQSRLVFVREAAIVELRAAGRMEEVGDGRGRTVEENGDLRRGASEMGSETLAKKVRESLARSSAVIGSFFRACEQCKVSWDRGSSKRDQRTWSAGTETGTASLTAEARLTVRA